MLQGSPAWRYAPPHNPLIQYPSLTPLIGPALPHFCDLSLLGSLTDHGQGGDSWSTPSIPPPQTQTWVFHLFYTGTRACQWLLVKPAAGLSGSVFPDENTKHQAVSFPSSKELSGLQAPGLSHLLCFQRLAAVQQALNSHRISFILRGGLRILVDLRDTDAGDRPGLGPP